ncbi:hypothetical protein EYF80_006963 [Liparis tanakae]|uniref:Uncharacterized protein n=1 Tax=Liparis tanakae TaxID=230148 RepID=A0A4Z2IZL6_9TELE|nr:hypothetical protein EYF80_006963 [Liparis tanakae]
MVPDTLQGFEVCRELCAAILLLLQLPPERPQLLLSLHLDVVCHHHCRLKLFDKICNDTLFKVFESCRCNVLEIDCPLLLHLVLQLKDGLLQFLHLALSMDPGILQRSHPATEILLPHLSLLLNLLAFGLHLYAVLMSEVMEWPHPHTHVAENRSVTQEGHTLVDHPLLARQSQSNNDDIPKSMVTRPNLESTTPNMTRA